MLSSRGFWGPSFRLRVSPYMCLICVSRVIFKWNKRLVFSVEKVKIEYFFKKIYNFYVHVSVHNDTINNSETNISWPKIAFSQFCDYIFQITHSAGNKKFCSWCRRINELHASTNHHQLLVSTELVGWFS